MKFSNAVMLELLSKEGRAELFEPFVLREILRGQWDITLDLEEVELSFEEAEAEIAALVGADTPVRADLVIRGVIHSRPKGLESDSSGADSSGDEPRDPFSDPAFKSDGAAAGAGVSSFPIAIGCLTCEPPLDLREMLFAGKSLRHAISQTKPLESSDARFDAMVGLIVPGSMLDDDAWPGSERITGSKTRRRQLRLEHINSHLFTEGVFGMMSSSSRR